MWQVDQSKVVTAADKQAQQTAALIKAYSAAIQKLLDDTAQTRRYDSIQTAVSYRDDPNTTFAAEAEALFAWRSAVWTTATTALAEVQSGERVAPAIDEFVAQLPPMAWPIGQS